MDETRVENGGLKNLIFGLDNWVAEIISFRNRVLIVKNTIESIDTPETNVTGNKIDMSRGDSNIVTVNEIEDDLLPPAEYVPFGIFPCCKVVDPSTIQNKPVIYYVTNRPDEYPYRPKTSFATWLRDVK
ncbi:hypothetical protein CEXT_797301 [Caerostris extrusa]|uniref:Uncharacterized protein n=1 Tax=Caerostris extrusa TaxID=172846 RepID=A0AAV4RE24_CAEEX|nr:hypothetical protein CEXT_797301 [Caerostris extrusa]